jgi:MEMO1 family protein
LKASDSGIRLPAVAGYFYPSSKEDLRRSLASCFENSKIGPGAAFPIETKESASKKSSRVNCFVVPHAGYEYSGPVAAFSYLKLSSLKNIKLTAIILGPNHNGIGSGVALSPSSKWRTPLGDIDVNRSICEELSRASDLMDTDALAHLHEHSIEVQLPFLQAVLGSFSVVPISMMLQDNETSKDVSEAIRKVILSGSHKDENFVVLASSDLTHYEPQREANQKDHKVLEKIRDLDVNGFYTVLERDNVTACGYGPIACATRIAKAMGSVKGEVLKYATSGDSTGDYSAVVGYSAVQLL